MKNALALLAALWCAPALAQSQGTASTWTPGYKPSIAEWQSLFASKGDASGGTFTSPTITGGTISGVDLSASTARVGSTSVSLGSIGSLAQSAIPASSVGVASGVAGLDASGTLSSNLAEPSDASVQSTLASRFSDTVRAADYGMRCDFRTITGTLVFAANGTTMTNASPGLPFTQADVGAYVFGSYYSNAVPGNYAPQAYRTITSVTNGVATLADGGTATGGFVGASSSTSSMDIGHDDSASFLAVWAEGQKALYGGEIDLPGRQCLMMNATPITEAVHTLLRGQGMNTTQLVYADNGDGLKVIATNGADLTARDFSIKKYTYANAGTAFNGDGFYYGSSVGDTSVGRLFAENIGVYSNYTGDAWNRNFEFENITNAHGVHLYAVGRSGKDTAAGDVIYPGSTNQTWGPTAVAGHGASFYIHGSNGGYALDSTWDDLVSTDNDTALDLVNYQGQHFSGLHFINGNYAVREMPGYNADTDEDLSITGSLLQAY